MKTMRQTTSDRLNIQIAAAASAERLGKSESEILSRLEGPEANPLIGSIGACSVHVLRRHVGRGWRIIGYAVWSCRQQGWVHGAWEQPVSMQEAFNAMADIGWDG